VTKPPDKRLADKAIVVTGGASGIGAACARAFAAEGATVFVADVDAENGSRVAAELGDSASFVGLDVTDEGQWEQALDGVLATAGRLDGLLNAAGIGAANDSLEGASPADWDRVLRVNLDGTFLGCKHAVRRMKHSGGGSIVNIASILAMVGGGDSIAYCASKGGVRLLTQSAALHCAAEGYAIRCNSICPGYIDTPMTAGYFTDPKARRAYEKRHLLNRLGEADEIAPVVLYLLADESAYVTGAEFTIDGGYTAI
jgi:NAD(P)-dependent dehydrogenase (short-subunit alcohol dehydrogenase family)